MMFWEPGTGERGPGERHHGASVHHGLCGFNAASVHGSRQPEQTGGASERPLPCPLSPVSNGGRSPVPEISP
jgi:hypothetical protein